MFTGAKTDSPVPPIPEMAVSVSDMPTIEPEGMSGAPPCESHYVGIGVLYRYNDGRITDAPESLPAYEAGVRVGDRLLDIPLSMTPGKTVRVVVGRNGQRLTLHITPRFICEDSGVPS